jgi:hypothetical protein
VKPKNDGPGVPEAIPRTLQGVAGRLGAASVDRGWIFPPRVRGRKEAGLLVGSRFALDGRRRLFTASYSAERTGKGLTLDWSLSEEGAAPPDRFPPVVAGVGRRAGDTEVGPRNIGLEGDPDRLAELLLGEWDRALLDPALWPMAAPPEPSSDPEPSIDSEPSIDPAAPSPEEALP